MMGAAWVTIPRQIKVVAEESPQPIYFELVEEIEERKEHQEVVEEELKREERRFESLEKTVNEGSGIEARASEQVVVGGEKVEGEATKMEEAQEEEKSVAVAPQHEEQEKKERAKVVALPKACGRIVPIYPKSARRKGREGSVIVEAKIATNGVIGEIKVVSSSGYEELDKSAVKAVETATFEPAVEDNHAIEGSVRMTFDFKLTE